MTNHHLHPRNALHEYNVRHSRFPRRLTLPGWFWISYFLAVVLGAYGVVEWVTGRFA